MLRRIVEHKRREIAARRERRPLEALARAAQPSRRDFRAALSSSELAFILECKQASPSRGAIRRDYDPVAIARAYEPWAAAISVLADERFFGGCLEHVTAVARASRRPVLLKDFLVDPYQVFEARAAGADAVLLMMSVLDDATCARCLEAARALSMDALVEVHDADELARALALGANIVGINNRDLRTLEVDLSVTERLAPLVPRNIVAVGESGICRRADVRRLRPSVDAFLVGSQLMDAVDPGRAARELIHGRVKVCGLTRARDVVRASAAGALEAGLIFAEGSPRALDPRHARELRGAADLDFVGVFVNEEPTRVAALARSLELAAVQLHGDESPRMVADVRRRLPETCELRRAVRVNGSIPSPARLAQLGPADRLLLDAGTRRQRGGTGQRFDWQLLRGREDRAQLLLAGGIGPAEAAEADALGVAGLDVNSRVERAPGVKCPHRLARTFAALRGRGRS